MDAEARIAVLRGSILSKQVAVALAEAGFFTGMSMCIHSMILVVYDAM